MDMNMIDALIEQFINGNFSTVKLALNSVCSATAAYAAAYMLERMPEAKRASFLRMLERNFQDVTGLNS